MRKKNQNKIGVWLVLGAFFLLIVISFIYKPGIVGYVTVEKTANYSQEVSWTLEDDGRRTWFLSRTGELKGVRISGSYSEGAVARAYIELEEQRYLIFDTERLEDEDGAAFITGAAVFNESNSSIANESSGIDEREEDHNISDERQIYIGLEYKSGSLFDEDDDGRETIDGAIDLTVEESSFSWDLEEDNVCTKWTVYSIDDDSSTTICHGAEECCNFIGLSARRESWDDDLYLGYGSYGATENNNVSAQVIHVDYSFDVEDPYSDVYYSEIESLTAEFYHERIEFDDICIESCLLGDVNESFYDIVFEVEEGEIIVESIGYSVKREGINFPPEFESIPNQTMESGSNITIDLGDYASDPDNDSLSFSYYETDNISITIRGYEAEIAADKGFTGNRFMFFKANDSNSVAVSNIFQLKVEKSVKPAKEETIQVFAEIGKPVKWVKKVKLNETAEKMTVNVTKGAKNISVKKKINNISYDVDKRRVKIIDNETIRDLEEYNTGVTGAVTGGLFGKGFFSRWLSRGITGAAVTEVKNASVNLTGKNVSQVVIDEEGEEYEVEYYTDAPQAFEKNISRVKKQLVITSKIPYQNILSYMEINEAPSDAVRLYWYVNESEYYSYNNISINKTNMSSLRNFRLDITGREDFYFSLLDQNNNSLADKVQWVTPHLSNQTFEVEINVLNVQSYPMVKGNWTVMFTTVGEANLTISAINETSYTEVLDDEPGTSDDLEILELRCGNDTLFNKHDGVLNGSFVSGNSSFYASGSVNGSFKVDSFFYENYSCNSTGYWTVKVSTAGVHNQELRFGFGIAYANNMANYRPITDIIVFSDMNETKTYTIMSVG